MHYVDIRCHGSSSGSLLKHRAIPSWLLRMPSQDRKYPGVLYHQQVSKLEMVEHYWGYVVWWILHASGNFIFLFYFVFINVIIIISLIRQIVKHCPKLERIHLLGSLEADTFFFHLAKCFPFARNLRDLRCLKET